MTKKGIPRLIGMRMWLQPLLLCVAVCLRAQGTGGMSASGSVPVHVAMCVSIDQDRICLSVSCQMRGNTVNVQPTDASSWRFKITGQGGASIQLLFPLSTILRRTVNGNTLYGSGNQLTFTRKKVNINRTSSTRSSSVLFLSSSAQSGQTSFLYTGASSMYFWVGGSIWIPSNTNTGTFIGDYVIVVEDYSI